MKKKEQEVDVLKALLAKLQKYGRNVDHHSDQISLSNGSSGDQKRKGHNTANTKREVCSLMFNTGAMRAPQKWVRNFEFCPYLGQFLTNFQNSFYL